MKEAQLAGWLLCRSKKLGHLPAVMPQKVTRVHPTPPKHLKIHDAKKLDDRATDCTPNTVCNHLKGNLDILREMVGPARRVTLKVEGTCNCNVTIN